MGLFSSHNKKPAVAEIIIIMVAPASVIMTTFLRVKNEGDRVVFVPGGKYFPKNIAKVFCFGHMALNTILSPTWLECSRKGGWKGW